MNYFPLRHLAAVALLSVSASVARAQTGGLGIGTTTPNASAALDISSTTKGLLLPRLSQAQRDAITSPPGGLVIFQTDNTPGLYAYSGSAWALLAADNLGNHNATTGISLSDNDIYFRGTSSGDTNHGLGYYGPSKQWNGVSLDGPVLYGWSGGILGTNSGGTKRSALFWNSSGNVGIGTTSPAYRLHVVGGDTRIAAAGTQQSLFGIDRLIGFDDLRFYGDDAGNTELMRLQSNGNLGLGTPSPSALLDVNGSTRLRGLTTAGVVTTDASGNLGSAPAASLDPTTASNGLTKTGSDFTLGGTLTGATTISTSAANTLTVNGAGAVNVGTGTGTTTLGNTSAATALRGSSIALTGTVTSASSLNVNGSLNANSGLNASGANITGTTNINSAGAATTLIGGGTANVFVRGVITVSGPTTINANTDITGTTNLGTTNLTGTASINTSGTAATSIGTGASAGTVTIGRSGGTLTLGNLTGAGTRVVTADASGNLSTVSTASLADNLGNHAATQNLDLSTFKLVGNGGTTGLSIANGGTVTADGALNITGSVAAQGLTLPGAFGPDATYVGVTGNSISFGHTGVSEDFIGYKSNTFYLKDSPGGGDTSDPNLVVGGGVGIGTTTITTGTKLDVAGNVKLGTNGTSLAAVIKATVNKDLPNIANGNTSTQTFSVANATVGATVFVSPANALTDGLVIQYARVSAGGIVEVKFHNHTGTAVNESAMDFYLTVIQ